LFEARIGSVAVVVIATMTPGLRFLFAGFDPAFLGLTDAAGRFPLANFNSV
jgi:hypothetical protein